MSSGLRSSDDVGQEAGEPSQPEARPSLVVDAITDPNAKAKGARPESPLAPLDITTEKNAQAEQHHRSGDFTPPGSPGGLHKEHSVNKLFQSARRSFGGGLSPASALKVIDHPVRKRAPRMVTAQDWDAKGDVSPHSSTKNMEAHHCTVVGDVAERDGALGETEQVSAAVGKAAADLTVVASAPGKVILFGEHAVVYGKMAVAAAVSDLRIVVTARATADASLCLDLPDLKTANGLALNFRRTAKEVAMFFSYALALAPGAKPAPPSASHLELISDFLGDACSKENKKALLPLVFLALALVPDIFLGSAGPDARGLSITAFSSSLPVGAGLGSSAALCVASSAALTRLARLFPRGGLGGKRGAEAETCTTPGVTPREKALVKEGGDSSVNPASLTKGSASVGDVDNEREDETLGLGRRPTLSELEEINAWAYAGETVLHGTPSGLDNTVSCFGGAIKFLKGLGGAANITDPIPGFPPLPTLLTNTLVPRETRDLVARVRRLREAHPAPTNATFDAIGAVGTEFLERAAASTACSSVMAPVSDATVVAKEGAICGTSGNGLTAGGVAELAEMNHHLLCALGVGHPALERVCALASGYGCKSKLTGAGGGGCALTILRPDLHAEKDSLIKDLTAEGFRCYESSLGGPGMLWHDEGVPRALEQAASTTGPENNKSPDRTIKAPVAATKASGFSGFWRDEKGAITPAAAVTAATVAAVATGSLAFVLWQAAGDARANRVDGARTRSAFADLARSRQYQ